MTKLKELLCEVEPLLEQIVDGKQCWTWGELMLVRSLMIQIKELQKEEFDCNDC